MSENTKAHPFEGPVTMEKMQEMLAAFERESPEVQQRILDRLDQRMPPRDAAFFKTFLTGKPHAVKR